ncbi:MAG: flagellar biosynthesis protein FliQ [Oligoflexia bacterium]|nr:flagellar biosynthesis protein FliQ [Oligoflexia bacterium]
MTDGTIMDLSNQALKITMYVGGPMLLGALVTGILVSLFQAVTQINEQTLTFIPKILVIGGAMVIFGPWMLDTLGNFTRDLIINIPSIIAEP